jgi:opacity protein-like surface antigen
MKVMRQLSKFAAGSAAVAVAAIASVGIAQADGMPSRGRAVVYEKPSDWSGFYFGVHSGWQWSQIDASSIPGGLSQFDVSHDSPVVGGQIGIQHQFGNFVLGIEGTLSVAFQDDYSSAPCPNPAFTCAARFDDVFTIGPRLGWAMGKWMPYLTGGYANAAFSEKISLNTNSSNPFEDRQRHSGWFIGGGVDLAMSHGWTIGLEYRHYEFDDAVYQVARTSAVTGLIDLSQPANRLDVTSDIVTLRASWKLGRPEAAPLK